MAEILKRLTDIEEKWNKHILASDRKDADRARADILRFGDEVKSGTAHTEEAWNEILSTIDSYERFCGDHPDYPNTKAVKTIERLKSVYAERLEKNDFL